MGRYLSHGGFPWHVYENVLVKYFRIVTRTLSTLPGPVYNCNTFIYQTDQQVWHTSSRQSQQQLYYVTVLIEMMRGVGKLQ